MGLTLITTILKGNWQSEEHMMDNTLLCSLLCLCSPGDNNGWPDLFDKYFGMPSHNAVVKSNLCREYWISALPHISTAIYCNNMDFAVLVLNGTCNWPSLKVNMAGEVSRVKSAGLPLVSSGLQGTTAAWTTKTPREPANRALPGKADVFKWQTLHKCWNKHLKFQIYNTKKQVLIPKFHHSTGMFCGASQHVVTFADIWWFDQSVHLVNCH